MSPTLLPATSRRKYAVGEARSNFQERGRRKTTALFLRIGMVLPSAGSAGSGAGSAEGLRPGERTQQVGALVAGPQAILWPWETESSSTGKELAGNGCR